MDGQATDFATLHSNVYCAIVFFVIKFLAFTCVYMFGVFEDIKVERVARNDGDGLVVGRLQDLLIDGFCKVFIAIIAFIRDCGGKSFLG